MILSIFFLQLLEFDESKTGEEASAEDKSDDAKLSDGDAKLSKKVE